nr:thyrotropin-releasing hormone receptor-like [Cherax quadricarinatus]
MTEVMDIADMTSKVNESDVGQDERVTLQLESVNMTPWSGDNSSWDNGLINGSTTEAHMYIIDHIQQWLTPVLVVFGCVGNITSVWVFHSSKLRSLSSSCYLAALAASDTVFLLTLLLVWLSMVGYDLLNQPGWCQAIIYASYVATFLSVWLVVAFTVERFIAVCYPLLRAAVCTVRRARLVILALTIVALLLYSYLVVAAAPGMHPTAGRTMCKVRPQYVQVATTMNHIDTVLTLVLPVLLIVTLNVRIARCVWHVERLRHSMTLAHSHTASNDGCGRWAGSEEGTSVLSVGSGRGGPVPRVRSQNKVTKMLLIISTVFILLNMPSYVMRAYILFWCGEQCDESVVFYTLQQTFTLLFYTNFAINFLLYCVTGQNFRRAVAGMCLTARRCRRRRRRNRRHPHHAHPSPGSTHMPCSTRYPLSTLNLNPTGSVINIQQWEAQPQQQQQQQQQDSVPALNHRPQHPPTTTTPNGHTRLTTLPDEKEDSF